MRAVWLTEFGPPGVLVAGEAPDPEAGEGQAVVEVHAAGVTFVETQIRAGRSPRPGGGPALPIIPGNGVGGVVTAVGPGVDPGLVGQRVVTSTGGSGGYAERVAADAGNLLAVPDGLGLRRAVALLADGRTAAGLVRQAGVGAGEWVLVEAAGGGVGSLLVQLARNAGAKVIAAASSRRKLDLAGGLGARAAVDYTQPGWTDRVREATGGSGVSVAFDGVGGEIGAASFRLMAPGGRFVVFGLASGTVTDTSGEDVRRRGVQVIGLDRLAALAADAGELTRAALEEARAGRLRPVIGQTFPLERAADAHAAIEARTVLGKTLLVP